MTDYTQEAFERMPKDNKLEAHYSDDRIDGYLAAPQFAGYTSFVAIIQQLRAERDEARSRLGKGEVQKRHLVQDEGRIYWIYKDGSHRCVTDADCTEINAAPSAKPVEVGELAEFVVQYFAGHNYSHHEKQQCLGFSQAFLSRYNVSSKE